MRFKILLGALTVGTLFAATPAPLSVSMASESVPPGATVQLKIFLTTPAALVSGTAMVTLASTIFDTVTAADVYSATGDQGGAANIQGLQVSLSFGSATGGIGRLPGLPLFTITVPVLPTAHTGASFSLNLTGTATDLNGAQYTLTAAGGTFTVGGDISVTNVVTTGGLLPTGSIVEIDGDGFIATTQASINGCVISASQVVSPQRINLTLGAPANLDERRVAVRNPGGSEVDFFPVLHGPYVARPTSTAWTALQPIFPEALSVASYADSTNFRTAGGANTSTDNSALALQNPGSKTVNVTLVIEGGTYQTPQATETAITLPPGSTYIATATALGTATLSNYPAGVLVLPDSPIRMVVVGLPQGWVRPSPLPLQTAMLSYYPQTPLTFNWTVGSQLPSVQGLHIIGPPQGLADVPFNISTATASGGGWLGVSPSTASACQYSYFPDNCSPSSSVQVLVNPQGLAPGTYQGTLTVVALTPGFIPQPATLPVTLNVYSQTQLFVKTSLTPFSVPFSAGQTTAIQRTLSLSSTADPAPFTVSVATPSGQKWLSVSPTQGQTPITLTALFDPTALKTPSDTATITIQGQGNSLTVPVIFQAPPAFGLTAVSLSFFAQTGQPSPASQSLISTDTYGPYTFAAQTNNGGNWLSIGANTGAGAAIAMVTANSSGLSQGTYTGTVTVTPAPPATPVQVPVTLTVYNTPPALTVSPSSVTLTAAANSVIVTVSTGNIPLTFDTTVATDSGGGWLYAGLNSAPGNQFVTPGSITVGSQSPNLPAGTYTGRVTVRAPAGGTSTVIIPVTYIAPGPTTPIPISPANIVPTLAQIVNAGSQTVTSIAPGEIVTIFGQGIGPNTPVGFALGTDGKVSTNPGGVSVSFNGQSAPVIYASSTQINAIVPYEVSTAASANISVTNGTATAAAGSFAVIPAFPGIFTLASNGKGPGAILNQDNSVNSAANPVERGSVIQIFATGAGQTSPPAITGEITATATKQTVLPVTLTVGGLPAQVLFAGAAPQAVSGLLQVNAVVPTDATPGSVVPIVLTVGATSTQTVVTLSVK